MTVKQKLFKESVSDRIKELGFTITDISERVDYSLNHLSRSLKRKVGVSDELIKNLAVILDMKPEDMYDEIEKDHDKKKMFYPKVKYALKKFGVAEMINRSEYSWYDLAKISGYTKEHVYRAATSLDNYFVSMHFIEEIAKILKRKPEELYDEYVLDIGRGCYVKADEISDQEEDMSESSSDQKEKSVSDIAFPVNIDNLKLIRNKSEYQCMINTDLEIEINSDKSYTAKEIRKWCRRSICCMTDKDDQERYDPVMAGMISDFFFRYFINRKKPLLKDAKYFVRRKKSHLYLKRYKEEYSLKRVYMITRTDENGIQSSTEFELSKKELKCTEDILKGLGIDYEIRDITYLK